MIIGVPKEIKNNEFRVAMTAAGVHEFTRQGHTVLVENGAGIGSGITDAEYAQAGASLVEDAAAVWGRADMIVKVKEPIATEYPYFRKGLGLFTYLHLAAEPELTTALMESGVTAIAYETVQVGRTLPLLAPMSEVAGRLSVQVGAQCMTAPAGGKGMLLGGQVEVGEQHQALAEVRVLGGDGLLDLHDHVGPAPNGGRVLDEAGAGLGVFGVRDAGADARAVLHQDGVALPGELVDAGGRHGDPEFVVLDLLGNTNDHNFRPKNWRRSAARAAIFAGCFCGAFVLAAKVRFVSQE